MKKTEEERVFENGVFRVACPNCGYQQYHALYEIDNFFGCPNCHEFAWLRIKYLDREKQIVYGLQLVQEQP
jgi:hypothetical protein